jgi:acyl-CoA thioesterase-1
MATGRTLVACALALAACSNPAPKDAPSNPPTAASSASVQGSASVPAASSAPAPPASGIAAPAIAPDAGDATDAGPAARDLKGKTVLHCGDSMVGGAGGLTKALEAKFKAAGARFVHDSQVSAAISVYDKQPKLKELLARNKPDIVIITLGANEVFVPFPVRVLREHVAPCKFFDSSDMKLERAGDGIHPTDKGGAAWAEAFWVFFQSGAEQGEGKLLQPKPPTK